MDDKTISRRGFLALGTALAGALAVGGCTTLDRAYFPGIRFFPGLGIHGGGKWWAGDASFVQDFYDQFAAPREDRYFLTDPRYWFIAEKKLSWETFLVDATKAPSSHEEARDPNWSNYQWNQNDIFDKMLHAPAVLDDKAKVSIFVAMTATAEQEPVPPWMADKGLTWRDGKKNRVHVRMDLEEGWRWMADFLVALIRRYGHRQDIAQVVIGEYYIAPNPPEDLDKFAYIANAKKMWADVIANAPKDEAGNRMNIVQVNPILRDGLVTSADIAELKLGVSDSDPYIFINECGDADGSPCAPGSRSRARQDLYGVVPLHSQTNAAVFRSGHEVTWTGIDNPFGLTRGQRVPLELQHVTWYHASKGVVPLNSVTVKGDSALIEDWFPTFDRFGPNGTDAAIWGQIPKPPAKSWLW